MKALRKEVKDLRELAAMQANMGPWMNPFLYHGFCQSTSGTQPQMPPMFPQQNTSFFPPQNHYTFPQNGSSGPQQNTFNFSQQVPTMVPSAFGGTPQVSSQPPAYYPTMFPGFNNVQGPPSMQPTTQPFQFMPISTPTNMTQDENANFIDNLLASGGSNNNTNQEKE
ncbi:unnamed protein product [Cuscuta epithymum]|uniref:Uncharacterized protein n=1 Tax=Cuscuta epithymum TaxID=186058 RepID=A0AAV0DMF3_9ASTE|nr:unnamed protein product [Cuscuta epithymum]